jgi:anti-anti-sigma factor
VNSKYPGMAAPPTRTSTGSIGSYFCQPPWTALQLDLRMRQILGLGEVSTIAVDTIDAAQADYSPIRYGPALAEAVRSAQPLVVTTTQRRYSDGALRTLVTVINVVDGPLEAPNRLQGSVIDVTDDVYGCVQPAHQTLIGIVSYGSSLVVLLCGELDLGNRERLGQAMDTVVQRSERRVYLDASQLRFCDAASFGLLAETAVRLKRAERPVVLLHCSPVLDRMRSLIFSSEELADITIRCIPVLPDGQGQDQNHPSADRMTAATAQRQHGP